MVFVGGEYKFEVGWLSVSDQGGNKKTMLELRVTI